MPLLDERHDFAHPVESDSAWSESYYFNCYDPDTAAGSFMRPGTLAMDVTFSALIPAVGTDGQGRRSEGVSAEAARSVGRGHLEQAGRWSGWIEGDGRRHQLGPDARGNRDKSWGPRRWGGPNMWRWFSINVGAADTSTDHVHYRRIRRRTDAGDLHRVW